MPTPTTEQLWAARDRAWKKYDRAVARKNWAAAARAMDGILRAAKPLARYEA